MPTLDEARHVNEAIIEAYLEANPGAYEAVAFAADRMQEVLDYVKTAHGACARAATIMCGVAWAQPFSGANKRTGVALARLLLNRNGFDFDCPTTGGIDSDRLRRTLYEVQGRRACLDPEAVLKVQVFLWPRLRTGEHEAFGDAVSRIIRENGAFFDHMAREAPLPAALSAEEAEANEVARKCTDVVALAERIIRTQNKNAASFTPGMIRRLVGAR